MRPLYLDMDLVSYLRHLLPFIVDESDNYFLYLKHFKLLVLPDQQSKSYLISYHIRQIKAEKPYK